MLSLRQALVRIVPLSFAVGAGIEFFMLRVQIGHETFYDTAIRLEANKRREVQVLPEQQGNNIRSSTGTSNTTE